jgi:hypothetical protein
MLHRATAQLLRIARLALLVEKSANVLRQFRTQKLDASGFRIRAKNLIRGRNLRWFGIHDLSPLRTDYLPRFLFCTSVSRMLRTLCCFNGTVQQFNRVFE